MKWKTKINGENQRHKADSLKTPVKLISACQIRQNEKEDARYWFQE